MIVRPAVLRDVPVIRSAYLTSWRAGYQDLLSTDQVEQQAAQRSAYDWTAAIEQPYRQVFVAETDQIVGVIELDSDPAGEEMPLVQMLYVIPTAWGTGAAHELLERGVAELSEAGHTTCGLRVAEGQSLARRFYEREGWQLDLEREPGSNGLVKLLFYRREFAT